MDQEEYIIYDDAPIKKEYEDPLSIEEVPMHDPLGPETESRIESDVAIKEEAVAEWNKTAESENEKSEEIITSSQHTENDAPVSTPDISYAAAQLLVAPLVLSSHFHSPARELSCDALDLSRNGESEEPAALNATSLQIDQNGLCNDTSGTHDDDTNNLSPSPFESNYADVNMPEVICLDSDSDNEQRDPEQVLLSNCNSESDVWSRNLEEPAERGEKYNAFENNAEPKTEHDDSSSEISNKKTKFVKIGKVVKKRKAKEQKLLNCHEDSLSTPPALCEDVPGTSRSLAELGESCTTMQEVGETMPAGVQATASSQELLQDSHRNQSVWSPIHQIRELSSQILSLQLPLLSQQSTTPTQSSQLQSQRSLASVECSLPTSQHSVVASTDSQLLCQKQSLASTEALQHVSRQSPLLTKVSNIIRKRALSSTQDAHHLRGQQARMSPQLSAQSTKATAVLDQPGPSFLKNKIYSVKKRRLTDASAANSETKNANVKPQAEANATNINSEDELLNLKHKMELQELKLRLRSKKARAVLEESELKLKMETTMQELTNKKLKQQILQAKLQFYTKLCAGEKL